MVSYHEMLRRIEPEKIICYNTPFPEMQGNIIYVDYERSSWRYMNYERGFQKEYLESFKISGPFYTNHDTIEPFLIGKGGGSAYGGEWKPSKPADERFIGIPGEIKVFYKKDGTIFQTKIGSDGRTIMEHHYTVHSPNNLHSNPHDHKINWESPRYRKPNLEDAINYWDGNIPEFKGYDGGHSMKSIIYDTSTPEDNRFKTISEFKECIARGGEIVFSFENVQYSIFKSSSKYYIAFANGDHAKWCNTADEVLDYMIGSDRLRDVITQVTVLDRTI